MAGSLSIVSTMCAHKCHKTDCTNRVEETVEAEYAGRDASDGTSFSNAWKDAKDAVEPTTKGL